MWRSRKYFEGLIAKSLYEPLTDREQAQLHAAMARDASLRDEQAAMASMVDRVPRDESLEAPDLLPDLRIAIAGEVPERKRSMMYPMRFTWRSIGASAGFALVFMAGIFLISPMLGPLEDPITVSAPSASLMTQAIRQSEALVIERNPAEAMHLLETALKAQPQDPNAADARLMLAELAYDESLYDRAFEAYAGLQSEHTEFLTTLAPERRERVAERFELLDECRADNYETLLAFDAAMRESSNRFDRLEQVAARASADPHGVLASRVVSAMADAVEGDGDFGTRLERVRDRCANPLVAARASYEAGRMYETESGDIERAAAAYRTASEHSVYQEAAGDALARLNTQ